MLPLVALVVVVAAAATMVLVRLGGDVVDRAQARNAADAAALAAVSGGRAAASQVASANGARLERYDHLGDEVEVTVRVGGSRATARAAPGDGAGRAPSRRAWWPVRVGSSGLVATRTQVAAGVGTRYGP